jgi:hypothetical protein
MIHLGMVRVKRWIGRMTAEIGDPESDPVTVPDASETGERG